MHQHKPIIQFAFADVSVILKEKTKLKTFLVNLFIKERKGLQSLQYIFCSDEYLLNINRQFLNHDYFTDIITFELGEHTMGGLTVGEIYISTDRVRDNSKEEGNTYKQELLRVIFHGALHLCGYNDKTPKEIKMMREMEEWYLNLYGSI